VNTYLVGDFSPRAAVAGRWVALDVGRPDLPGLYCTMKAKQEEQIVSSGVANRKHRHTKRT
jgi:hypothetical protein